MSRREARALLDKALRGIKQNPWEVLDSLKQIKHEDTLVPCPHCGVNKIERHKARRGQRCYLCISSR